MTRRTLTPNPNTATSVMALVAVLAIFAVTAVLTFGGRRALGRSLDTQPTQDELVQARADAVAAIPKLPKDTEEKLAAALYPQLAPITAAFSDPIARAGNDDTGAPVNRIRFNSAPLPLALPIAPPVPEKLSRLIQWQQSVRAATTAGLIPPSITTAYLISEVRPTGRVDMKGTQGAWLYIEAEKRQIPANLGAKFYDGVLASIDPDPNTGGVVFRTSTGQTTMLHWDSQEDFSSTSPISQPPAHRDAQAEPQPQQQFPEAQLPKQKPVTRNTIEPSSTLRVPVTANALTTPPPTARIRDDYSDLQVAVRDRYPTRATGAPAQLAQTNVASQTTNINGASRNSASTDSTQRPSENLVVFSPTATSFSTPTLRDHKLNYAHAVYSVKPAHLTANTPAFRVPQELIFNRDAPRSFKAHETTTEETSTLDDSLDQPTDLSTQDTATDKTVDQNQGKPQRPVAEQTQPPQKEIASNPVPEPETTQRASATETVHDTKRGTLCDPTFRGEDITITNESNRPLSLLNLVNRLNENYGPNIVLDYDVQETPIRLTVSKAPWTSILRTLLDLNDLDMVCLDGGIVQIAKRSKIASMGDLRRRSAPVVREVFKLRYLQQTAGGRANLAGQTQASNGATIQSLEDAIRDILKAGGDPRGEARRVPGRNQLLVAATHEQMEEIRDLIARVDRPGYQVKISGLVYTANENRLRDIGSQLAIVVGNSAATNLAAGATLAATQSTPTTPGGSTPPPQSGLNPGGVPGVPQGMRPPTNGLGASNPLATFGLTSLFGTAQFAYQLTLAQQKGIVNIQSRPFGIVSDGDTFDLVAGTQIPVVTTTIAGGAPFQAGQVQFIEASRIARITPQVAEDEKGQPNFVTLNIQLENNSVDTSLGTFNGVPGVNRQSLQTVLRLRNGETVVIGGLAADQVSNAQSSVPGLGGIPLLGNLFKKRTNQENRDRLYFAITVEVIPQELTNAKLPGTCGRNNDPTASTVFTEAFALPEAPLDRVPPQLRTFT